MGKTTKVVWFASKLGVSGGGERLILEGLKCFEDMGIKTYLLVFGFNERGVYEGTYKPNIIQLSRESNGSSANFLLWVTRWISNILLLRKKLKDINPDVIISQGQWDDCIPLYLATLSTPFPYAIHIFGSIFTFPDEFSKYALIFRRHFNEIRESVPGYKEVIPTKPPKLGLVKRLMIELKAFLRYLANRKAKRIFVLSNQNKWEVKKLYGRDAIALKGAFPPSIFHYATKENIKQKLGLMDKRMVLSVCRLVPKKRVDLCIKAFKEVSNRIEDMVLVIGGTGPDENRLKSLVKELSLEPNVKFVGYITEEELWDYYACCDLFVHLDLADFDIAPYEALALGRKVVWTTEMEVDEFLDGNRFVFPTAPTVHDVAMAIEKALSVELGAMTLTEKANLSHYTWDNYFGRILTELENLLN
jgi:glycosyltransferase involved in cell wall biosynthesis